MADGPLAARDRRRRRRIPPRLAACSPRRPSPGARVSRAARPLLRRVPWRVATGGAGLIPHLALGILFMPALGIGLRFGPEAMGMASEGAAALCALVCSMIAGWRRKRVLPLAVL